MLNSVRGWWGKGNGAAGNRLPFSNLDNLNATGPGEMVSLRLGTRYSLNVLSPVVEAPKLSFRSLDEAMSYSVGTLRKPTPVVRAVSHRTERTPNWRGNHDGVGSSASRFPRFLYHADVRSIVAAIAVAEPVCTARRSPCFYRCPAA